MAPLPPVEIEPVPEAPESFSLRAERAGRIALRWLTSRQAHVVGAFAFVLLTLSGSISLRQLAAQDQSQKILAVTHGRLDPKAEAALRAQMDGYGSLLARASLPGTAPWSPPRVEGWGRFNVGPASGLVPDALSQDQARLWNALLPDAGQPIPAMRAFKLPAAGAERERALLCLSQAVYYEAGFEPGEGQEAVAQVVLNRLRHPDYPKSVCGVVYEGAGRTTGCQFSFTCDGSLKRPVSAPAFARARQVAEQALNGFVYTPVGAATHYHADYVFPYWSMTLVKLKQIGAHIFYRFTGPAGTPAAFTGRYGGGELNLPASVLTGGDNRTPDAPTKLGAETAALLPAPPQTKTITLDTGGETRSYQVIIPQGTNAAVPGVSLGNAPGVIVPSRRAPTPDEVKSINEKLQKFEDQQKTAPAVP
ncbi:MAG TPA: cell wall hydrolase [Caulobacteraceae bacterium]|nr:cell wall hydrolase [Caulobacteraceae bacterium]